MADARGSLLLENKSGMALGDYRDVYKGVGGTCVIGATEKPIVNCEQK
jgi:hypothetical protein